MTFQPTHDCPWRATNALLRPSHLIAWLGASAGGLWVLFAFVGLLARGAHDHVLGLPWQLQPTMEYVIDGVLFAARSTIMMMGTFFVSTVPWVCLAVILAFIVITSYVSRGAARYRQALLMVVITGLLVTEVYTLGRITPPLLLANLLTTRTANESPTEKAASAILRNDTDWLNAEYGTVAVLVITIGVSIRLLEWVLRYEPIAPPGLGWVILIWRRLRVPAYILFVSILFFLPCAYGVLAIQNQYPEVMITVTELTDKPLETVGPYFLLREEQDGLLLYNRTSKTFLSLQARSIKQVIRSAPTQLFTNGERQP